MNGNQLKTMLPDGYLGQDIPKLGFGLMRLPKIDDATERDAPTDAARVQQMVDEFLDAGFTYFDTARAYGDSEATIKKTLVDKYPRSSYQLATKNAAWIGAKTAEEAKAFLQTSLDTTGAEYFDFYMLHNIGAARTKIFDDFGMWDFLNDAKRQGIAKHIGISFHDQAPVLDRVLTEHPEVEFVQLQVNYVDWNAAYVQSGACFETAHKHGKPVIIMEPVKGGLLANPPKDVAKVFEDADPDASLASWALRFVADLPGVVTILSGMSNIEQMRDNIKTFKGLKPLSESDSAVIERAQEVFNSKDLIGCTGCHYCDKECPKNLVIPGIFNAVNQYRMFGNFKSAKGNYDFEGRGIKAAECIGCGQCERSCPQGLPIISLLKDASALFDVDDEKKEEPEK